jgi:hypothetical protein
MSRRVGIQHHARSTAGCSTFFRWCIVDKGLRPPGSTPCTDVWLEKAPTRRTKWNDRLFWAVRDLLSPMHQCYYDLSFLLYQRRTDVRQLDTKQIRDGVIHFEPTKTRKSSGAAVDVPITPEIQAVLDRASAINGSGRLSRRRGVHARRDAVHPQHLQRGAGARTKSCTAGDGS